MMKMNEGKGKTGAKRPKNDENERGKIKCAKRAFARPDPASQPDPQNH